MSEAPDPVTQKGFVVVFGLSGKPEFTRDRPLKSPQLFPFPSALHCPILNKAWSIPYWACCQGHKQASRKQIISEPQAKEPRMACKEGQIFTSPKAETLINCFPLKLGWCVCVCLGWRGGLRFRDHGSQKKLPF